MNSAFSSYWITGNRWMSLWLKAALLWWLAVVVLLCWLLVIERLLF